jgi:hypothetical protein
MRIGSSKSLMICRFTAARVSGVQKLSLGGFWDSQDTRTVNAHDLSSGTTASRGLKTQALQATI